MCRVQLQQYKAWSLSIHLKYTETRKETGQNNSVKPESLRGNKSEPGLLQPVTRPLTIQNNIVLFLKSYISVTTNPE